MANAPAPSIDTHFHLFAQPHAVAAQARYQPAYAASYQAWQALAGSAGIAEGLVVQPSFLGTDNSELIAALDAHPNLRGVAVLGPDASAEQIKELDRHRVTGLRWNMVGQSQHARWRDPGWAAVLRDAHALGWHLELHVDPGELPLALAQLPQVPIPLVLDHFGKPAADPVLAQATFDAAARCAQARPVFVKLSGPYRNPGIDLAWAARQWRARLGPDSLLWGSDWPWTNHESALDYSRCSELASAWLADRPADVAALDRNARSLFGFD